jgi:hypothetical protein
MGGAPQVAMRVASQIWQIVFASQTLQVFCFCFANPLGFSFGPSQKGTICSSDIRSLNLHFEDITTYPNISTSHIICLSEKQIQNITIYKKIHEKIFLK